MTYWTRKLSILPSQTKIVMKPFLRHLVLVLLSVTFMLPAFFLSSESVNERSFKRDRDGIQVFTRRVESSKNKAMNATMSIQAPVHAAVALVRDTDASAEWAVLCKESYKDEVVSEKELNVYTYNDISWPVSDRNTLAHVVWYFDEKTDAITVLVRALKDRMERSDELSALPIRSQPGSFNLA